MIIMPLPNTVGDIMHGNHLQFRLRAFRYVALVNFEEWFPDSDFQIA